MREERWYNPKRTDVRNVREINGKDGSWVQGRAGGEEKRIITEFPEKYADCEFIEYDGVIYINKNLGLPSTCCAPGGACATPEFLQQ